MKFWTVTLAPAIDATVRLRARPRDGEVVKDVAETENVGGKGINVARALALLGNEVTAGGLLGADNAGVFARAFAAWGVRDAFVRVPGATRRNEMITWPEGSFKLNRPAFPGLSADDWSAARVVEAFGAADGTAAAVVSGSLPAGAAADTYAGLTELLHARGVKVWLDASGAAFARGVEAGPDLVKPNAEECAAVVGFVPTTAAEFGRAAEALLARVPTAVISDGANGCWFADRAAGVRFVPAPRAERVVDTTAAGDTLLAALAHAWFAGGGLTEAAMRRAVAAGTAAVGYPGADIPRAALEA